MSSMNGFPESFIDRTSQNYSKHFTNLRNSLLNSVSLSDGMWHGEKPYVESVDPSCKMASYCLESSTINIDKEQKNMSKNSYEKKSSQSIPIKAMNKCEATGDYMHVNLGGGMLRSDSFNSTDTSFSASSVQSQELSLDMQSDLRKRVLKGRKYLRNSVDSNGSLTGGRSDSSSETIKNDVDLHCSHGQRVNHAPARKKHRSFHSASGSDSDCHTSPMNVDEKPRFDNLCIRHGSIYALLAEEERRTSLFVDRYLKLMRRMLPNAPKMIANFEIEEDLAVANCCMSRQLLPGGLRYIPVHPGDALLPLAVQCGIPVIAVALGASYMQRLISVHVPLRESARAAGWIREAITPCQKVATKMMAVVEQCKLPPFSDSIVDGFHFDADLADTGMVFKSLPHAKQEAALTSPMLSAPIENSSRSLILVYATCIYIAAKVVDRPQYRGLLTAMLSAIIGQQVSSKEATSLEAMCLQRLEFRLGPTFC